MKNLKNWHMVVFMVVLFFFSQWVWYITKQGDTLKTYGIEDLFQSINDIYYQLDEGKMDEKSANELGAKCCAQFLRCQSLKTDIRDTFKRFGYIPPSEAK